YLLMNYRIGLSDLGSFAHIVLVRDFLAGNVTEDFLANKCASADGPEPLASEFFIGADRPTRRS
ncbi:MAG: hypothetical protein JWO15_3958, partial [Sphingomonadales bacterium]|nr:hypothetical protein [Sphingomonadales bacterium]